MISWRDYVRGQLAVCILIPAQGKILNPDPSPPNSAMAATASFDKHPTLWFDDGNVVLIAENTGFRVYRGVLAKHSEIFRDMFLLPHPDSELAIEDTYDGCPIVRMAEDEAHEWEVVLGVLYTMSQCRRYVVSSGELE